MRYKIIKFGDRDGNGAIVQTSGFLSVTTWTANNDYGFEKWVCRENGKFEYKALGSIDLFYKSQFDTRISQ